MSLCWFNRTEGPCILKGPTGNTLIIPLKLYPRLPGNFHLRFRSPSVPSSVQNKRNVLRQEWPTLTSHTPAWRRKNREAGVVWTLNQTGLLNPGLSRLINPGRANRSRGEPGWTSRCLWCFPPVAPESEPGYTPPNSSATFWIDRLSATPSRHSKGRSGLETGQCKCFCFFFFRDKKSVQVWVWQGC